MDADTGDLRRLATDLSQSSMRVGARAASVLRDTAKKVEASAKANTPVVTGALRESIGFDIKGDGRSGAMTAEFGPTLRDEKGRPVGRFVEYGTASAAPRPYMHPALDAHLDDFERQIADALGDIL